MNRSALLTQSLELAPSELFVANLNSMKLFYEKHVGLEVLESGKDFALLGFNGSGVIRLVEKPNLAHSGMREAGLFHNAVLFGSQGELSRAAGRVITEVPQLLSGTGDHLVSEAFYFYDPEGNGVELYYDRPRESWQWVNGQVVMDTLYIDPLEYISSHASEQTDKDKKLGHVHLKIGDIEQARAFYVDLLGFSTTAEVSGALFVSIGGYHHHLGLNTWMSAGAGLRATSLGISNVTITLNTEDDVALLAGRLEEAEYPFRYTSGQVHVADPWANNLTFTA